MRRAASDAHRAGDRAREPRSSIDVTMPIERQPAYLRLADVAALLGKSVRTISSWEQRGLLRVTRPAGGAPLIARAEIERLLSEGISAQSGGRSA